MQTAQSLLQLQDIDLETIRAQKALEELPQRALIQAIRAKRDEVTENSEQVAQLRENNEMQVSALCDEDAEQEQREKELELKIKEAEDYRVATSLTHDLESCAKRREKIAFDLNGLEEKSKKIKKVELQVADALAQLSKREEQCTKEFISEGGVLKDTVKRLQETREELVASLGEACYKKYDDISKRKGGIAVSVFEGDHCSVCRVELPEAQIQQLVDGPLISECPHCHRIIITKPFDV